LIAQEVVQFVLKRRRFTNSLQVSTSRVGTIAFDATNADAWGFDLAVVAAGMAAASAITQCPKTDRSTAYSFTR